MAFWGLVWPGEAFGFKAAAKRMFSFWARPRMGFSVAKVGFSVARVGFSVAKVGFSVARVGFSAAKVGFSVAQGGPGVGKVKYGVAQGGRQPDITSDLHAFRPLVIWRSVVSAEAEYRMQKQSADYRGRIQNTETEYRLQRQNTEYRERV